METIEVRGDDQIDLEEKVKFLEARGWERVGGFEQIASKLPEDSSALLISFFQVMAKPIEEDEDGEIIESALATDEEIEADAEAYLQHEADKDD